MQEIAAVVTQTDACKLYFKELTASGIRLLEALGVLPSVRSGQTVLYQTRDLQELRAKANEGLARMREHRIKK